MKFLKLSIILLYFFCIVNVQTRTGTENVASTKKIKRSCEIDLGAIQNNEPIFLDTNHAFRIPTGDTIVLNENERILIDCGQDRSLSNFNGNQQIEAVCNQGTVVYAGQRFDEQPDLNCTDSPIVRIQRTAEFCGGDGRIFKTGFFVQSTVGRQTYAPVLEICFDEEKKSIFFVKSLIYGKAKRGPAKHVYKRPDINNGYFTTGAAVTGEYFGVSSPRKSYSGFDRGHYAPNGDYPFAPHRESTFSYFNMGPMSKDFNRNKWSNLEEMVRRISRGQTADILTGGFYYNPTSESSKNPALKIREGTVNMLTNNNNLANNQRQVFGIKGGSIESIIIPNYFWKIVKIGVRGTAYVMPTEENLEIPGACIQHCTLRNQNNIRYYECNADGFMTCTNIIKGNFEWPKDFRINQLLN